VRFATLSFAFAAFAATLGPASAQEPANGVAPTAEELIARSKLAEDLGRRPETERETWDVHLANLDGTLTMLRRGDDTLTETSLGPFHTERGVSHGERWHQNENGETVLDRPEPSQSDHPVASTVERVHEPVDAWALTTIYASGHVTRIYYDPRTYYVVRSEKTAAGHTVHTSYDDFRTDQRGRTRFWHYYGGDDRPDNDFDYRLTSDDIGADVAETDVAIPHDRRTVVEFPVGVDSVRLPARVDNDRIYVRLVIGGRGLDFLLDTGASSITINDAVARELKLPLYGRSTQTVAGSFVTGRVVAPEIAIGALTMHDIVMHTVPISSNESRDTRIVGLLGFDFLDAVALKIDYANGTVDAMRPGTFVPPAGAASLDVRLNSGTPVTHATVGDASGDDFILDTGAAFTYLVFQRFTRAHPEAFADPDDASVLSGSGVGGSVPYRTIGARRIGIGAWNFDNDRGAEALSPNALGFDNEDGLIGGDILKLFTVYLDYGSSRVFLAPNGREPMVEAGGDSVPGSGSRETGRGTPPPHEAQPERVDGAASSRGAGRHRNYAP
jgi:predicted aspartyl protease